jgi:hypothetical protein
MTDNISHREIITATNRNIKDELILKEIPEESKKEFKSYFYEAAFWKSIAENDTPIDVVEEREGFFNKDTQQYEILEYIPEEYVIGELNRLFPGWWTEDMKRSSSEEVIKLRSALVEGYLCVEYPTIKGTKITKKWAIGGAEIIFRKGTKDPVDIPNTFKSARTYWLKLAAKLYGIGLDIYHQKISPSLRRHFEDAVREWGSYADEKKKIAKTLETGHGFRNFLKDMPNPMQTQRFIKIIEPLSSTKKDAFWKKFVTLSNKTPNHTEQLERWLASAEQAINKIKEN